MKEWLRFKIEAEGPLPRSTESLTKVHHIVHLQTSRRILEDRHVRAGLIHDESKLNKTRLCVAWLSANEWYNGSLYGTVRFTFDWKKVIQDRSLYWVESMNYNPPAYRLLVTDRDLSGSDKVTAYDSKKDEGPVQLKDGVWLWNGKYTSEFMVEADLRLAEATGLDFVTHSMCREAHDCKDKTITRSLAGAQTFAFLLGNKIHCVDHLLGDGESLNSTADQCVLQLWRTLARKDEYFGGVLSKKASTEDVLLGALALFGSGQQSAAKQTMRTLKNEKVFNRALTSIVRKHFDLPDWIIPE